MITFDCFWTLLEKENPQWWEMANMRFHKKDIKKCAQDCHVYILADEKLFKQLTEMDGAALRKYFTSWLMKAPDAPVVPQLQQEEVKQPSGPPPLTGEERQKRIKEWQDMINGVPVVKKVPPITHKEMIENGGWIPAAKAMEYHRTPDDILLTQDAIKREAAEFYKGVRYISGFKHFPFGEFTVFASSKEDAEKIFGNAIEKLQ